MQMELRWICWDRKWTPGNVYSWDSGMPNSGMRKMHWEELPTRLITIHFQLSALIVLMICHVLVGLKQNATWLNKEGIDGSGIGVIMPVNCPNLQLICIKFLSNGRDSLHPFSTCHGQLTEHFVIQWMDTLKLCTRIRNTQTTLSLTDAASFNFQDSKYDVESLALHFLYVLFFLI